MSAPYLVPSLDQIADAPDLFDALPSAVRQSLYERAEVLAARLRARLLAGPGEPSSAPMGETLLDVEAAAQRLGCSVDWVYRHQAELPVVRIGRHVKIAAAGLDAYIRRRQGRR